MIEVVYVCSVCSRRLDAIQHKPVALTDGTFACPDCWAEHGDEEDEPNV